MEESATKRLKIAAKTEDGQLLRQAVTEGLQKEGWNLAKAETFVGRVFGEADEQAERWKKFREEWERGEHRSDDETPAEVLFNAWMEFGAPKKTFDCLADCVIKPDGDVSLWSDGALGTDHLERGHEIDCDGMLDQLYNCDLTPERRDRYLKALVDAQFGSVRIY